MFTCSNCGHKINAPESRLPPFCPRCGTETGVGSNPFADSLVDDDDALPQLPDLPPPPPMDSLPLPRDHGRSGPSKTLFGMPGVNPDELQLDDPPPPPAKPAPPPVAAPKPAPPPIKPAPAAAKPPSPPPAKPSVAPPPPAKPAPAAAKPPTPPPAKPVTPPPPAGAKPATPPVPPPSAKPATPKPPLPGAVAVTKPASPARTDAPTRPAARTPSGPGRPAPALAAESGTFDIDESGAFEKEDPFFTGDPDELPELGSITDGQILSRRPPSGPVSAAGIALGSGANMQEFEFEGGGSLELGELELPSGGGAEVVDLPTAGTSRDLLEFDGIDMPLASGELDLPSPVAAATDGLDLPMPTGRHDDLDLDGFGPPGDLDLPLPSASFELDPITPAPAPPKPAPPPSKPATPSAAKPASASPPATPKPAPAPTPKPAPAATPKPAPAPASKPASPSKPAPASLALPEFADDLDLPTPSVDLPGPIDDFPGFTADSGLELEDLPLPADELPTPAGELPASASMSKSSGNLPASSGELPTPIDALGLDLDDEPAVPAHKPAPTPASKPAPPKAAEPPKAPEPPKTPGKSPAPKPEKRSPVRAIVYGTLGVVVVAALVGVYGMGAGWFDEEIPLPPPQAKSNDDTPKPTPGGAEVAERSDAILAKFDEDSPAAYVQVLDGLAQDPVAQAEAALLLHLRYGPDPERLARAGTLLEAYADNPAPHVRRVLGLALLGQPARRAESLTWFGDDPRSQLYRAWALHHSDPAAARTAAEAAAKARPNDKAAALVLAELELERDAEAGLAALRKLAEGEGQPSAKLVLVEALHSQGLLAEAATIAAKLSAGAVSSGHKGEQLRLRAEIAFSQGNMAEATRLLDQAIATDPSTVGPRIDKVELSLAVRDLPTARSESDVLLKERPQDREVMMLVARVAIEAGRDDDANAQLTALGGPESSDPAVHDLYGELAALLLDVEAARKAWTKARELEPLRVSTVAAEVELLLKVEQVDAALALLDEQKTKLAAREDHESLTVRAALARLERTRARVLRSRGEPGPALTAAEEATKLDPRDNAARLLRAELLAAVGNVEASEEAIEQLYERTGGFPGLTDPLGRMLLRKGKLDQLDALIGTQLDASEASVELLMTGAALRLAQNKPEAAKLLAERVIDRDSTALRARLLLGRALLALGEYGAALDEIEASQSREPSAEVELWMGQALEYNGRAVEARPRYKKALELEPGNLEAAALLGRLYAYEGAAKAALALLEPVVQKTDAYPYAYLAIGIAHRDLGKRDQAVGEFQRARELDPTLFEAYYEEGRILNDSNKHSSAASALQAGLDNAKANALPRQLEDAWRRLGDSYFELGRKADAKTAFEEYLKIAAPNAPGRAEVMRQMKSL